MTGADEVWTKYAHVERERRFLVTGSPELDRAVRVLSIEDRYLVGTRLRLRTVREQGAAVVHKLGQKVRLDGTGPGVLAHTTLYLDGAEHRLLADLPARTLGKTRYLIPFAAGLLMAVDVFTGSLGGLVLAEVDLGEARALPDTLPVWFGREVTGDESYTGGALAALSPEGAAALLGSRQP